MEKIGVLIDRNPHRLQRRRCQHGVGKSEVKGKFLNYKVRRGDHQKKISEGEKHRLEIMLPQQQVHQAAEGKNHGKPHGEQVPRDLAHETDRNGGEQ